MAKKKKSASAKRRRNKHRSARRTLSKEVARRMQTWKKTDPSLIYPVMKQAKDTCYAYAYVGQLEFMLKKKKLMPQDEHLSVQEFINLIPRDYLADGGALKEDASLVLSIFEEIGIVLAKDCKLTECLDLTQAENTAGKTRYFATKVSVHKLVPKGKTAANTKEYFSFHSKLVTALKQQGAVAVGLTVYPSYSNLKKNIYTPKKMELAGGTPSYGHVMLCTGHNYDKKNRLYYQFQESAGAKVGDKGFVKVYAEVVHNFIEMEVD